MKTNSPRNTADNAHRTDLPSEYLLLILSVGGLLVGIAVFAVVPPEVQLGEYRTQALSFLAALVVAAVANIVVGLVQKGVSREAERALRRPIQDLQKSVHNLRQIQAFLDAGLVGVFPNRSSAMQQFLGEIEREDKSIDFVGTSLLGTLDPDEEHDEKRALHELLLQKRRNGVRIRALLMHPAYGEFRERVENREKAAVAKDIQNTLRYLISTPAGSSSDGNKRNPNPKLLEAADVRLYPGVITALAIFTGRAMLVNVSTLHGPVYDNFTLVVEDTPDPNSIFKMFKANHFSLPWGSEKSTRLDGDDNVLHNLISIDFRNNQYRFKEGDWPPTIHRFERAEKQEEPLVQ